MLNLRGGFVMSNETIFEVACLYYEICGATETFYSEEEYEIYGDDYVCPECYDQEDMAFMGLDSFPMSLEYNEG
jgi:hypothetical protein